MRVVEHELTQAGKIGREQGVHHTEEDHAGAGAAQGLVGGGGDHVAVLEGLRQLLSRHQATAAQPSSSIIIAYGSDLSKMRGCRSGSKFD